jgi:outer membrane protein assembly factor BamA
MESYVAMSLVVIALLAGPRTARADEPLPGRSTAIIDEPLFPIRIDALEIHGLVRTHEDIVVRELPWRVGAIVTREEFELGITRLWNTPLFSMVHGAIERREGKNVAIIEVDERWPLTPVIELQSGGNATWFHLGATDRNLLGRYLEVEAFYEYFNAKSGGRVWFRDPRFLNERVELVIVADRLMRTRPDYVVRTTRGRVELNHLVVQDLVKYGVRVDGLADDFLPPTEGSNPSLPGDLRALIVEPGLRVGRIDYVRLRDKGLALETRVAIGTTTRSDATTFRRVTSVLEANAIAGTRWNFGVRAIAGHVSHQPDEMQFFIGGLDLLRGYPDNHFKATAFALYNADVKLIAFDSQWLAILPVVFSDGATIRRDDGSSDAAFSVGGGTIFVIPKIADSQLRIDVGVPLRPPYHPGVGFGTAAFF